MANENIQDLPFQDKANLISQMFGENKEVQRVINVLRDVSEIPNLTLKMREHKLFEELYSLYSEFYKGIKVEASFKVTASATFLMPTYYRDLSPELDDSSYGLFWEDYLLNELEETAKDDFKLVETKFARLEEISLQLEEDLDTDINSIWAALERIKSSEELVED